MADALSPEQAKEALANAARGRVRRIRRPTTREAKENLRRLGRTPTLLSVARTQPFLGLAVALGYGVLLGSDRKGYGKLPGYLLRILTWPVSNI